MSTPDPKDDHDVHKPMSEHDDSPNDFELQCVGEGLFNVGRKPKDERKLPTHYLPCGIPPILTTMEEDLRSQLEDFDAFPIHSPASQQKYVERVADPSSLLRVSIMPSRYGISLQHDVITGEISGYKDVRLVDAEGTAMDSFSLNRAPVDTGNSLSRILGSSINIPFWPGGFDAPQLNKGNVEDDDDLLVKAPFCTRGIALDQSTSNTAVAPEAKRLFSFEDILEFDSDEDEVADNKNSMPAPHSVPLDDDTSEQIDGLIADAPDTAPTPVHVKTRLPEAKTTQYAIKLDVNQPIPDFYEQVPDMAYQWPFELDTFQKQAVLCLENRECVFVAAHTSAGKTVVAEYAIALCQKHMTKAIYTSPIKALSNQKFRDFKLTFTDVGLITGDIQLNPEASCLIMTTEILRSMLYGGSDIMRDVEWVIFDEVHYINDRERGVVWEEVLIMLPAHVSIILLSATVPNFMEFADWVGRTKKRNVYVISTTKRPVPLEHYLYTGNSTKTSNELFLLVDSESKLQETGYRKAMAAKKERESNKSKTTGPKGPRAGHGNDKNVWLSVIEMLRKKDKLPAVAFTFSAYLSSGMLSPLYQDLLQLELVLHKKRIEETSLNLSSVDLTTATEKSKIITFIKRSVQKLKGTDQMLPQVVYISDLLTRGIGVHHSGVLPILKEIVELLFQQGLIKILFATETFAMGVNMPARTVVFDSIRKHDGTGFRDLKPAEYIQMAGRAGRRGLDTTGTVIILCKGDVPHLSDLVAMMLGRMTILESQFRLTYRMMLNLLRVEMLRIQEMLKRSFSEFSTRKHEMSMRSLLDDLKAKVDGITPVECYFCAQDIESYYTFCRDYLTLRRRLLSTVVTHPACVSYLSAGKVILVRAGEKLAVGVVLNNNNRSPRLYRCLILTDSTGNSSESSSESSSEMSTKKTEDWWKDNIKSSLDEIYPHQSLVCAPVSSGHAHIVLELDPAHIHMITTDCINVPSPDKVIENYSRRQIPRFKDDPPTQTVLSVIAELSAINLDKLEEVDAVKEFKLRDLDMRDSFAELNSLRCHLNVFECVKCSSFPEHFKVTKGNMKLRNDYDDLKFKLSDASLQLLPEYQDRVKVLRHLKYISEDDTVQLKGKVACEITQQELLVTELLFENTLDGMHYTEIAALLSCVVFEQKNCSEPNLTPSLEKGVEKVKSVINYLGEVQKMYMMDFVAGDYATEFKFGLVEVVYEWAKGTAFNDITNLTDVQEGIIVRCIQRLDELLRNIKDAARVIGDPVLGEKMDEASRAIKRDIVFAASLYTQ